MKLVCQLDPNGYFVGTTYADEDPLTPGEWLIPGGCVDVGAPGVGSDKRARWVSGDWVLEDAATPPDENALPADPAKALVAQIEVIELQNLMSRPMREMLLLFALNAGLDPAHISYAKVREVEEQIQALRVRIRMEKDINE